MISGLASSSISIYEVVLLAYVSSFLSDIASFFLGYSLRNSLRKIWPFTKYPHFLQNGQAFFKKYGMVGLFVGKFIGPIRPLLPITAGSLNMNLKKFFLVEILSCFLWALVYTVPGYYAAQALVSENINLVDSLLILIGVVVLFMLMRYFSKKYT